MRMEGTMTGTTQVRETEKSVEEATAAVEAAAARHGFGVLHRYDFREILRSKGFDLEPECRVLEVCSPAVASEALASDIGVNLALPCRISVYEEGGRTRIGSIRPTALLALVSEDPTVEAAAKGVEETIDAIIAEAV